MDSNDAREAESWKWGAFSILFNTLLASFVNFYKTQRHDSQKCDKCINKLTQLEV